VPPHVVPLGALKGLACPLPIAALDLVEALLPER
jgi:hypothetical protein